MKNVVCFVLLFVAVFNNFASATYTHSNELDLKVLASSNSGIVTVQMRNATKSSLRVWTESNSWGAARWRVTVIRKGKTQVFFENPDQDFMRNLAGFDEIASRQDITRKLDLNGDNWCGMGRCTSFKQRRLGDEALRFDAGDIIVVAYDVPFTPEAHQLNVWYGVAAASITIR